MTKTEREEIKTYVIDLLKESGDAGIKGSEIEKDCNLNGKQRLYLLKTLAADYPELVVKQQPSPTGGHESVYFWIPTPAPVKKETHSAFLKNRYEKTNKNNEGYTDMTAHQAIKNVEPKTRDLICPEPGQVWAAEESNGSTSYIYVVSYECDVAQCIKLYSVKTYVDADKVLHGVRIKLGAETLLGDLTRLTPKPKKYLIRRALGTDEATLMKVRKELGGILGIQAFRIEKVQIPVEVEKVVEKVVYKELEVPEGCIAKKDHDLAMARKETEIWRSAFWGLAKTLGPRNVENS